MIKKIIKNITIFLPDKIFIKLQYLYHTKKILNLKNPKRYTEKLQWYKLYYRKPLMTMCADKYLVRKYIESKGLKNILTKLYAVYDSPKELNSDVLPEKFVIKTNNGSGTNIFVYNKLNFKKEEAVNKLEEWLTKSTFSYGREWCYKNIIPKIVVEEFLEDQNSLYNGINDYKFICFNGDVKIIILDIERFKNHKRNFYDRNWNYLDVSSDHPNFGDIVEKPQHLLEMIRIAESIAKDFPAVRVDLYLVNEKIYFGEITFYPWSGLVNFYPDDFDFKLGEMFLLPNKIDEKN